MAWAPSKITPNGFFIEKDFGKNFEYKIGAPNAWASEKGATHTLFVGDNQDRPAIIKKTVAYVMVDEDIWEKWQIKGHREYGNN